MKTQNVNNKLKFDKNTLVELDDNQLNEVNGGTIVTTPSIIITIITILAK